MYDALSKNLGDVSCFWNNHEILRITSERRDESNMLLKFISSKIKTATLVAVEEFAVVGVFLFFVDEEDGDVLGKVVHECLGNS